MRARSSSLRVQLASQRSAGADASGAAPAGARPDPGVGGPGVIPAPFSSTIVGRNYAADPGPPPHASGPGSGFGLGLGIDYFSDPATTGDRERLAFGQVAGLAGESGADGRSACRLRGAWRSWCRWRRSGRYRCRRLPGPRPPTFRRPWGRRGPLEAPCLDLRLFVGVRRQALRRFRQTGVPRARPAPRWAGLALGARSRRSLVPLA